MRGVPVFHADKTVREWVGFCADITAQKEAERRLSVQYAVSRVLAESSALEGAAPRVLQAIGEGLGWELGVFWTLDLASDHLRCEAAWHISSTVAARFAAASRHTTFSSGVGLPGRVLAAGQPAWIADILHDSNFTRRQAASRERLRGAFAFPIRGASGVIGVMEFFSRQTQPADADLIQAVAVLGSQIGQFAERRRAEEAARESELRKGSILETAIDSIISIDHNGVITEFNPAAERTFGYTHDQAVGQPMVELIVPPSLRQRHREGFARYLATGAAHVMNRRIEMRALRADGTEFPIELTITRIPIPGPPMFTGYIRDISERERLEAALRQSAREARAHASELQATFETLTDAVVVYDAQGLPTHLNTAARALLAAAAPPESHTQPIARRGQHMQLLDEHAQRLAPDRRPATRLLRGEELTGSHAVDAILRTNDGRDIRLNISGAPLRDQEGEIVGAVALLRDVTQRRELERRTRDALQALLAMAETLVQTPVDAPITPAPLPAGASDVARRLAELACSVLSCQVVGIVAVDPATEFLRPIAVAGLPPRYERRWWANMQGSRLRDQLPAEHIAKLGADEPVLVDLSQPPYNAHHNYGLSTVLVVPMRVHEQFAGALAVEYAASSVDAFDGSSPEDLALPRAVARMVALVIERERLLREREEARATAIALHEANRRMDEFLSIASHEIKTPLTTIKANVQLLDHRLDPTRRRPPAPTDLGHIVEMARSLLHRSERQINRLNRLVDDLLDVSRIQADRLELRLADCDLAAIVRDAVHELDQAVPSRDIRLALPDRDTVTIHADADRVGQAVTNYLTNALKYSPKDRPVDVSLTVADDIARVSVRDEGPGLAPEERERVWERFYRAASVAVQSGSGVGLGIGLYISRMLISRQGGHVGVESTRGQGSTFWFTLPLAQSPRAQDAVEQRAPASSEEAR